MNRLICLIGPDGTGKSTQSQLLIDAVQRQGIQSRYAWLRFRHFISLPLLAWAKIMGYSEVVVLPNGQKIGYHYFYRSPILSKTYPYVLFCDTLINLLFMLYIPIRISKKTFICDRFVHDTLIDAIISTGNFELLDSGIGRSFLRLIPEKTVVILLSAEASILKTRRADIEADKNLEIRINLYQKLAKRLSIPFIRADLPVETIHKRIMEIIADE